MPYTEEGVKKVNQLLGNGWVYAGGDSGSHLNYWTIFAKSQNWDPEQDKPRFKKKCVCGQELQHNCWIYNHRENKMKVIGSECINKFLEKRRTCSKCGEEHRNRIVNRCNDCRWGMCDYCDRTIDHKYRVCYNCKFKT